MMTTHTEHTDENRDHRYQVEATEALLILLDRLCSDLDPGDPETWTAEDLQTLTDHGYDSETLSGWDSLDLFADLLGTGTLEIYYTQRTYLGQSLILTDSVTVVTGTGGPHTEAVIRQDGSGLVSCWSWYGSDRVDLGLRVPDLARVLFEILEDRL